MAIPETKKPVGSCCFTAVFGTSPTPIIYLEKLQNQRCLICSPWQIPQISKTLKKKGAIVSCFAFSRENNLKQKSKWFVTDYFENPIPLNRLDLHRHFKGFTKGAKLPSFRGSRDLPGFEGSSGR